LLGLPAASRDPIRIRPESEVTSVKNGIACHLGANLEAGGAYIPELTMGAGRFIETRFVQKQRYFPRIQRVAGTVVSLVSEGDANYYRWMMETLPRLRYVDKEQLARAWLYCRQEHPFHRRSMELLGCPADRILASEQKKFIQGDDLVVPRFVDETESWIIPWLREQFLPQAKKQEPPLVSKRIYISRRKASGRRVTNEADLLEQLRPLGFSAVALEDYDWIDQVALFQNAEAVVAPHGAGLTNLVFCSSSAVVVELITEGYPFTFFPEICRQLGMKHHLLLCPPSGPNRIQSSDFRVCLGSLMQLLRGLIG